MQFSNTTTKAGIIQQIEASTNLGDTGISGNAVLLAQFTAQVNNAYSKATNLIVSADGTWDWDDSNHTDLASATTDLVSGQSDYQILSATPSSGQDWLEVTGVNVKNEGGQWYKLRYKPNKRFGVPKQQRDVVSGQPTTFYMNGTQVFLDAEPNYSSTGGVELLFNRSQINFVTTDTTKRPGFHSLYHEYLVLVPTYWWEKYKTVGNPEQTKRDIKEIELALAKHYNNRNKYAPTAVRRAKGRYR